MLFFLQNAQTGSVLTDSYNFLTSTHKFTIVALWKMIQMFISWPMCSQLSRCLMVALINKPYLIFSLLAIHKCQLYTNQTWRCTLAFTDACYGSWLHKLDQSSLTTVWGASCQLHRIRQRLFSQHQCLLWVLGYTTPAQVHCSAHSLTTSYQHIWQPF